MERKSSAKRWLWSFSLIAAAMLLYKLYDNFAEAIGPIGTILRILAPFVGGFVLAFFMYGPSNLLEKQFRKLKGKLWPRLARPLALTITYLLLLGVVTGVVYLLIPTLVDSLTSLISSLPTYYEKVQQWVLDLTRPGGPLEQLGLAEKLNETYLSLLDTLTQLVTPENVVNALKSVGSVAGAVVNTVIAVIVSLYMLGSRESLKRALKNFVSLFVKPHTLDALRDYSYRTTKIFYNYFYGTFLDSLCVGIVVSIGLLIFRVPYAILLGMMLGLLNMIPYFGAIIGTVIISLLTLLTNGVYTALGVAVYMIVIQQIDGNIIQPRVVGSTVGLKPIYVLLSITLFGGLFGFWGIFLAPPLMAIIQMLVRDAYAARSRKLAQEAAQAKEEEDEEE